ncbi:MAG: PP2C family protein-serine/threonine phosphatase, partial [Acidobacteriaceae bacterium]
VTRLVFLALLVWIVALGIRLRSFDGWLVLPTVILVGIARFQTELQVLHFRTNWFPFGIQVTLADASNLLLTAVLAILLLRRLLHSVRDQRRLALDVKQAQEVQQVILPQPRTEFPGLVVESEYRPALEVGGDFFQIVPNSADSSLLIIAGDVTGKGLKAGMLVALLVGAIRTAVETTADPRQILAALNRRLLGRGEAHATCLALRIAADGSVSLANAGHMPPYLNGQPVSIDGALPLGMTPNADFSVMRFTLAPGDRLVVISDGIVEATDQQRQLFGFDRTHQLLGNAASATEIAAAAQSWGQEDDISVISVTRTAVLAPVTA